MLLQFDPLYSNNWNRLEPKNRKNSTSLNRNRKWNRNRNRDNPTSVAIVAPVHVEATRGRGLTAPPAELCSALSFFLAKKSS